MKLHEQTTPSRSFGMKIGVASWNSSRCIHPAMLARELEERGFESLWFGEHSHIPVATESSHPSGRDAKLLAYTMNPLVSLAAAASVTTRLNLGTSVLLVLEHDLLDLA